MFFWGAHAPSRAGDRAPAIANFSCPGRLFWRGAKTSTRWRVRSPDRRFLRREDGLREFRDERADDDEKENPNEAAPFCNGEPCADGSAENAAERHRNCVAI